MGSTVVPLKQMTFGNCIQSSLIGIDFFQMLFWVAISLQIQYFIIFQYTISNKYFRRKSIIKFQKLN
jgi:hypothetical protein